MRLRCHVPDVYHAVQPTERDIQDNCFRYSWTERVFSVEGLGSEKFETNEDQRAKGKEITSKMC